MNTKRQFASLIFIISCSAFLCTPLLFSQTYTLDWSDYNTNSFTHNNGTYSTTLENVSGSGVDVLVDIEYSADRITYGIADSTFGGVSGDHLYLALEQYDRSDAINVNISFVDTVTSANIEVSNVSFDLFDVDSSINSWGSYSWGHQDQVRDLSSSNLLTGDLNESPAVDVRNNNYLEYDNGDLTGLKNVDSSSKNGNASISFEDSLTEFSFDYGSALGRRTVTQRAAIGLSDIQFDVISAPAVPEAGVVYGLFSIFGLLAFHRYRNAS